MNFLPRQLHDIDETLRQLKQIKISLARTKKVRQLYKELRSVNANNIANELLVHSTNVLTELDALSSALVDAKTLLILKAKQYEQANISRIHAAAIQRGKSKRSNK